LRAITRISASRITLYGWKRDRAGGGEQFASKHLDHQPDQRGVVYDNNSITIEADATDADGVVEWVEFFDGTNSIGSMSPRRSASR